MKVFFLYIFILLTIFTSCDSQKDFQDKTTIGIIDTAKYGILHFQAAPFSPFDSSFKEITLSLSELELGFNLFNKSLKNYNLLHTKYPIEIYKNNYKLQLVVADRKSVV